MNILMGLCGRGQRFKDRGYRYPKYLNVYKGAPMIYHAVETIGLSGKLHFVVRQDHLREYRFLEKLLLSLGDEIIICEKETGGAAESLLLAKPYIANMEIPLLSVNCDQYMSWAPWQFEEQMRLNPEVSYIVTYKETSPKCSYVKEQHGFVTEVREKKVISNDATIGYYHWAHTRDFFEDAQRMLDEDHRENGEYYVAPIYNYTIARGLMVKKFQIAQEEFWPVGTPEDLLNFVNNSGKLD